ncbi:hypothetical protein J6590_033437 [Homalodisca vitripennis]|nr:hypothetical protein J6590_033437 [Homalodisca vitripennis]
MDRSCSTFNGQSWKNETQDTLLPKQGFLEGQIKISKCEVTTKGVKLGVDLNVMAFADDVVILSESLDDLSTLTKSFIKECQTVGLELNEDKTKIIHFGRHAGNVRTNISIDNYLIGCVESFKYLGVTINSKNVEDIEIQSKLANEIGVLGRVQNSLRQDCCHNAPK